MDFGSVSNVCDGFETGKNICDEIELAVDGKERFRAEHHFFEETLKDALTARIMASPTTCNGKNQNENLILRNRKLFLRNSNVGSTCLRGPFSVHLNREW